MVVTLYKLISDNRERILLLWQAAALPRDLGLQGSAAAKRSVVSTDVLLKDKTAYLFDWLVSEEETASVLPHLREMCKIKAVMTQSPSEALGFILDLKGIIRLVLGKTEDMGEFDKRIDQLMLLALDEYSGCREQIMQIKIDEVLRMAGRQKQ